MLGTQPDEMPINELVREPAPVRGSAWDCEDEESSSKAPAVAPVVEDIPEQWEPGNRSGHAATGSGAARVLVLFQLPDGSDKEVSFSKKPLGLDFYQVTPLKIWKVKKGLHGAELNIKPDWIVKKINGQDMTHETFQKGFELFSAAVQELPKM